MSVKSIHINGKIKKVVCDNRTPLLWVIRDVLGLTGTKFGCGKGLCGACTVHVDGASVRSCSVPFESVQNKKVLTIEGLARQNPDHPLFVSWKRHDVPQCGYCQPGQIMNAAAAFSKRKLSGTEEINAVSGGNICRCGTYLRIRQAIKSAGEKKV